jgi:hypothetical protein
MRKIKSIKSWINGQFIEATQFQLTAINVNLENSANFYYGLYSDENIKVANGNLFMEGQDYQNWQNDQYAWDWAATKLNLELLPELIEENKVIL